MTTIDPRQRERRNTRARIVVLCGLLMILPALVLRSAYQLQVVRSAKLKAQALQQSSREVELAPKRGTIYDRAGAELAVSADVDSIWANPRQLQKSQPGAAEAAHQLASLLDVDEATLASRFAGSRFFVWVKRRVSAVESRAVQNLKLPGISVTKEPRRFYPNRELASNLIGMANLDGRGIDGLELMLDEKLRGRAHSAPAVHDGKGAVVYSDNLLDDRANQGDEVTLTIDKSLQHFAERELELAVRTSEAHSGTVVVLDPATGELLAIANYPTFNPNDPRRGNENDRKNRAVSDQFEPGSTMKPFTMAGALAAGVVSPSDVIDCSENLNVSGNIIHDAHKLERLTPAEIISHSSNIGISKIGTMLGRQRLQRALSDFGFGSSTGSGLPGEVGGVLRPYQRWYAMDAATIPFGQGMSATTLQLAMAMGALANQGRLMEPILVKRVTDAHGQVIEQALPHVKRQVVPEHIARLVTDMLVGVTGEGGTGTEAAIDGYLVAGKTGTAQKADGRGGYAKDKWVSSFVGYAPAAHPRLTIAVVLDEPMIAHLAGAVAAPAFRRIMEASLRHLGVPADHGRAGPDVLAQARAARAKRGEEPVWPLPENVEQPLPRGAAVGPGEAMVPNLVGRSARAAVVAARHAMFNLNMQGTGIVTSQQPAPGAVVALGAVIDLQLSPPTPELPLPPPAGDLAQMRQQRPQPTAAEPGALTNAAPRRGQDG